MTGPTSPETFPVDLPGPGGLGVMAHPRGGSLLAADLAGLVDRGYGVLVCLLTDAELIELGLVDEVEHGARAGLQVLRLPVADFGVPAYDEGRDLAARLAALIRAGESVVVHCRGGVGRSSTLAALVLLALGVPPEEAWARLERARGCPVPETEEQRALVARAAGEGTG